MRRALLKVEVIEDEDRCRRIVRAAKWDPAQWETPIEKFARERDAGYEPLAAHYVE